MEKNEIINLMNKMVKEENWDKCFKNLKLCFLEEDDEKYIGWYSTPIDNQDLPIAIIYKDGGTKIVNLPPKYVGKVRKIRYSSKEIKD